MPLLFVDIKLLWKQQKVLRGRRGKHFLRPEEQLHGVEERDEAEV
jgi:hypothetical protein